MNAFTFTPKHGSWLNLVEAFFGKLARTMLRGLRPKFEEAHKVQPEAVAVIMTNAAYRTGERVVYDETRQEVLAGGKVFQY